MEPCFDRLIELLRHEPFQITEPIAESTLLRELKQWDSLKHLTLLVEVEKQFGMELTAERVQKIKTIGDLVKALRADA